MLAVLPLLPAPSRAQQWRMEPEGSVRPRFGSAVRIDGDLLLVAAPGDDERSVDAGAAYLFVLGDDGRELRAKILPPVDAAETFGRGIALFFPHIAIGEPQRHTSVPDAGVIHLYRASGDGEIDRRATVSIEDPLIGSGLGSSLSGQGDRVLLGAPGAGTDRGKTGAAFVYELRRATWVRTAALEPADGGERDNFGSDVALEDDVAAVGAPGAGTVYLYRRRRSDGSWQLDAALRSPDPHRSTRFGQAVAVGNGWLAVGDVTSPAPEAPRAGAVHLYRRGTSEGRWHHRGTITAPVPEADAEFGMSVALEKSILAVGAPAEDGMGPDTGAVYLFHLPPADATTPGSEVPASAARLARRLVVPSLRGGDGFGSSLDLSDTRLVVGAPEAHGGRGAVHVYPLEEALRTRAMRFDLVVHMGRRASSGINALARDPRGVLLLGVFPEGLQSYDGDRLTTFRHEPGRSDSLSHDAVLSVLVDRHDRVWVGTEDGLNLFDPKTGRFRRYRLAETQRFRTEPIVALFEDRDGRLWTGTNGRLYEYDPQADRFVELEPFTGPAERLDEAYISGLGQDSDGAIWVLAKHLWENHASLYRVDPASRSSQRFPLSSEWGQVGPMLVDSRDRIWIKAPAPVPRPTEPGRPVRPRRSPVEASHWAFHEASDGSVWIGTETGIFRRAPAGDRTRFHRIAPSAPPRRPWDFSRSFLEAAPGVMLVGTNGGLYRVRLVADEGRPTTPPLITRVRTTNPDGNREIVPSPGEGLRLGPHDFRVDFEFADLELLDRPGSLRLRYQLESFDGDWVDAEGSRSVSYTNLPAGDYVFRLRSIPSSPAAPPAETALSFVLPPPWWRTWWFRLSVVAAVAAFGLALYRFRRRQIAAVERLRRRIAGDLHDDLSTNLSALALLSDRAAVEHGVGNDVGARFRRVATTCRQMLGDLRDLVWLVDPGQDRVRDLNEKMRSLAHDLLGERNRFHSAVDDVAARLGMEERRELLRIYKELLHNAARHSEADRVDIRVEEREELLVLRVEDDGVGFDPEAATSGHGLTSIRARARRLGAELVVDSAPGRGTRAHLELPLGGRRRTIS